MAQKFEKPYCVYCKTRMYSVLKGLGVKGIFPGGTHFDEMIRFIHQNAQ